MITDKQSIQQLQFRTTLPRFYKEGIYIFAALEPEEQKLEKDVKAKLMIDAFAKLILEESLMFTNPLTAANPVAYKFVADTDAEYEWLECIYEVVGDANKFLHGRMKIYKSAFVYFVSDSLQTIPQSPITADWQEL